MRKGHGIKKPRAPKKPATPDKVRAKAANAFNKKAKTEMMEYPQYDQTATDCM